VISIQNPPSDTALKDSLELILQKAFSDGTKSSIHLYLVEKMSDVKLIGDLVKKPVSNNSSVIVNTLSLSLAMELRRQQDWLQEKGVHVISDYSNPTNDYENKAVAFYLSEDCRLLIKHIYHEVAAFIKPLLEKYNGSITPIGSDLLPDFPCKLDTDILICIPDDGEYTSFIDELAISGVFSVPPQNIGELHDFFYAELLGSPVDMHVYSGSLEENPLHRQTLQLRNDEKLRLRYKQFKLENEGAKMSDYRKAKALFRQEMGWSQ
jgi:hypothetical protein